MRLALAALAASLALTAAAYLPSLQGEFQFDDWSSLQANWRLRDPAAYLADLRPLDLLGPGRPVADLIYSAHLATTGLATWPFHLTGLAVHLAAAALAFLYARRLLAAAGHPRAAPLAAAAASLFALHPLQVEAVSYVAQLPEALASGLALLSLLLLHRADAAASSRARWGQALLAALVLLLALGAKTVAVTVPAAALLAALVLGDGGGGPGAAAHGRRALRSLLTAAPAWAVSLAAAVKVLQELQTEESAGLQAGVGPWTYLLTQCRVVFLYARLLLAPVGQSVSHPFDPSPGLADPATLLGVAGVLAALALAGWLWRSGARAGHVGQPGPGAGLTRRAAAFGILWWLLLLSPTSSVVPIVDLVAEHRVYLALLGPALALLVAADAWLAARAVPPRWGVAAAAAVLLALAGATAARAAVWRTGVSLWSDAFAKNPRDGRVAGNLANALQDAGRTDEARDAFRRALALASTPRQLADTARNFSALEAARGDHRSALAIEDLGIAAVPFDFELRVNRALTLNDLGRPAEGLEEARLAVRIAPGEPAARFALALTLYATGQYPAALEEARRTLRIEAGNQRARRLEFAALGASGDRAGACAAWARLRAEGLATPALEPTARLLACPTP